MPVVRRYQRQVDPAPIPGARLTAHETDQSTGANLSREKAQTALTGARVFGQAAEAGLAFDARRQHQKRQEEQEYEDRADRIALTSAQTQIGQWELEALNGEQGVFTLEGAQVFGARERIREDFNKVAGQIETGLNPRQREVFAQFRAKRGLDIDLAVVRHVNAEINKHETTELNKAVSNHESLAIANARDPRRVRDELEAAILKETAYLSGRGAGPEEIADAIRAIRTTVYTGVIGRLIELDQTASAQSYFDAAKDQISGQAVAKIEAALAEGTLTATSQKVADSIVTSGGTFTEQLEQVRAIEDPKLRDLVRQRVEHERSVNDKIERDAHDADLLNVVNAIDKAPSVAALLKMPEWSRLSAGERSGMLNYVDNRVRGVPVQTDIRRWDALMTMAGDDPEKFAQLPLLADRYRLDEGDYKHLKGMQLSIKTGDRRGAQRNLESFRSASAIVNDSLETYGLSLRDTITQPMEPETRRKVEQVRRLTSEFVENSQLDAKGEPTGKKPADSEIQAFVDRLLVPSFDYKSRGEMVKGNLAGLSIKDVPKDFDSRMRAYFQRNGITLNLDRLVLDAYILDQARNR